MLRMTSPVLVPSITWYLLVSLNWDNASGVWTVDMISMPPVSSALFIAFGSEKYLKVTVLMLGAVPQ